MNTIVIAVGGRRVLNELVCGGGVQTSIVVLLLFLFPLQFSHPNVSRLVASLSPCCQPSLSLKWEIYFAISSQQREPASYLSINLYMGYLNINTSAWIVRVRAAPMLVDLSIGRHCECHSVTVLQCYSQTGGETRTETGYILPAKSKRGKNYLISAQLTGWDTPDGRI